ncbi:amidohydrolase family protein [Arthrobacter psychrolactophilus]
MAERIAEGADYLKIFSGVGGLWPSLDNETIVALVDSAHERGLAVVAHVSSVAGVRQVVSAGVDVLAHVPADAVLDDELVKLMADAGVVVGPTLAILEHTFGGAARGRRPYVTAEENVRRLAAARVGLLAGTDAPNPGFLLGAGLHREMELLVQCGLSPAAALTAATSGPARAFGLDDRGRVAVGARADLLLVSGDPLVDIGAIRAIERIWRGGAELERRDYIATASEVQELEAFNERVAQAVAAVRARRVNQPCEALTVFYGALRAHL